MFNDMMHFWSGVPSTLAAAWAVWLGTGALLAVWYRKAKANLDLQPVAVSRTVARATSTIRPAAEPRQAAVAVPRPKPTPIVVGDPFGDLATLLDQPASETPTPTPVFRTPGESPILNSAGSPVLRNSDPEPKF